MKKYLGLLIVFSFVFWGYAGQVTATETFTPDTADGLEYKSGVNAGYTTTGENKIRVQKSNEELKSLREAAQAKMDKLKDAALALKDKVKAENQQNRLIGRENALAKFDKAINLIEGTTARVKAQIPKLKAIGISTVLAESKLVEVQGKLDKAKVVVAESHDIFASTPNELTKTQKETLKNKAKEAQVLIKEAHEILTNVVRTLREAVKAKKNDLPTTPSGVGGGGFNGGTDGPSVPTYACSYAPAPEGCTYVPGPEYNNQNSCGMILACGDYDGEGVPNVGVATPFSNNNGNGDVACTGLAPAPAGCKYVDTGKVDACGAVSVLSCPTR